MFLLVFKIWFHILFKSYFCWLTGNYRTVLCLVFLLVASNTTMEQNEAEVGRIKLRSSMDGSPDPLVVVGLFA